MHFWPAITGAATSSPRDRPFDRLTVQRRQHSQGPEPFRRAQGPEPVEGLVEGLGALSRFDKLKAPSLSRGLSNGPWFFSDRNATRASRPQQDRRIPTNQSARQPLIFAKSEKPSRTPRQERFSEKPHRSAVARL